MSFFSYALGALILILVLLRQVRVRPVPRVFQPRLPVVIGVIGLFEMFSYAGNHHVSSTAWLWVAGHHWSSAPSASASCAASPCGSGRATAGCCARATPLTMALWLVSLLVHFVGDSGQEPRRGGRARGGELPLLSGRDAGRAVLRRPPPGPAAVGDSSGLTPAGRCGCNSRRRPVPSSPASAGGAAGGPASWGPGPERPTTRDADRSRHHRRRGGRGRRRARPARVARAALIVPYTRRP